MAYILVVDDDDIVAEHAAQVLINAGHACGWVSDVKAAMQVLSRRCPDLILLDQNMPGESGTMMLRRLRNSPRYYDIPVIMLTGVHGIKDEQVAYYNGAQDYIRKPFSEKMLTFRVRQVLRSRTPRGRQRPRTQMEDPSDPAPLVANPTRFI